MPLFLSASSIVDFLDCSQRFYYRTTQREQGIDNDDMIVGTIVHYAIEKFWNDPIKARENVLEQVKFFKLPATKEGKALTSIDNFFERFSHLLNPDDEIEYKFKLPLGREVYLVGKMDRISNGNIFDWKTKTTPPYDISRDIQFILYNEAYRRIFGKDPIAVYYASLTTGKLLKLNPNLALTQILFNDIIPTMTQEIKDKLYYRKGLFTGACHQCSFKDICYEEANYVMDSTKFSKK